MDNINDAIKWMLILIPIGAAGRIGYCFIVMSMDGDDEQSFKARIRNVLIFCAVAECVVELVNLFKSYF